MAKIFFVVPGTPVGKGRPRVLPGTNRVVTPKETARQEKLVRDEFKLQNPKHKPFTGPVIVRMTAVFPIPASFTIAQREAARAGGMYYTGKPDKDNIEKLVYDALNGLAWIDDSQVSGGCMKRYGEPPRIMVSIEELEQPVLSNGDRARRKKADDPIALFKGRK